VTFAFLTKSLLDTTATGEAGDYIFRRSPRIEWIPAALCYLARRSAKVRRRVRRVLGVDETVIIQPAWGHGPSLQGKYNRKPRELRTRLFVGRYMTLICSDPACNLKVTI
jgi:hypothetical protein